jgi:hypothetical protein
MSAPRLDWRDPSHWSPIAGRCIWCGGLTQTLDDLGRPACKPCAEDQLPPDPAVVARTRDISAAFSAHLREVIPELGGKCATCGRLICACPKEHS